MSEVMGITVALGGARSLEMARACFLVGPLRAPSEGWVPICYSAQLGLVGWGSASQ